MAVNAAQKAAMLGGRNLGFRSQGVLFGKTGGAGTQVWWNDEWLRQAGLAAFKDGVYDVRKVAIAKASSISHRVARSISANLFGGGAASGLNIVGIVRASNFLGAIFEQGAKPHVIAPSNMKYAARSLTGGRKGGALRSFKRHGSGVALRFPDGSFSRGPVTHPGIDARPFLRPSAALFPALYNRALSQRLQIR
jgi:hypothetical protein